MNLGDFRTAVRERLDDPTFDTIKLDRWTNWVLQDIYSRANFPFKGGQTTFDTTQSTQTYDLTTIASDLDKVNQVLNLTDEEELEYITPQAMNSLYKDMTDDEEGKPIRWTVWDGQLKLYPIPDDTYEIQVTYVKTLSDLTDASQSPELPEKWSEIVVLGVYQKALEWNDDFDYASVIERQFEQKLGRLIASSSKQSGQDQIIDWYRPEI